MTDRPIKVISKHYVFRDGSNLEKEIQQIKARRAFNRLRHHVTGAIERGEKGAIIEKKSNE